MTVPAWLRYRIPAFNSSFNNRYPNKVRFWLKELRIPRKMAMLYLVRFKRTAPDYNPDQHISYEVWEMLYFSRSRPQMKTAWKYVQMFEQYAPHQILTPLDIFPVFCPHTCPENKPDFKGYLPAYKEHKNFKPITSEERAKRQKFIKTQIRGSKKAGEALKEKLGKY